MPSHVVLNKLKKISDWDRNPWNAEEDDTGDGTTAGRFLRGGGIIACYKLKDFTFFNK